MTRAGTAKNLTRATVLGAALTLVVAMLGLVGYLPGLRVLGSVREGFIPMAPSTAVCFLLQGLVLLRVAFQPRKRSASTLILMAVVALTALFGLLEIPGSFTGLDLNFEDRVLPPAGRLGEIPIARMSPMTGGLFFLAGIAICLLLLRRYSLKDTPAHTAGILASLTLLGSFVATLGYLMGTPVLYGQGATVPIALTTAIAFLSLSVAVVAATGETSVPLKFFSGPSTRARLMRAFIPLGAAAILIESLATLHLPALFPVNPVFIVAITVVVTMVVIGLVGSWISVSIGRTIDEAREALALSEERFSQTFHHDPDAIAITALESMKLIDVNEGFIRLTGFTKDEAIGKSADELGLWADPAARTMVLDGIKARRAIHEFETTIKTKTGEERQVVASAEVIELAKRPHIIFVARDITERKRAEEAMRESEGKYRSLFENANDAIMLINPKTTRILDCNGQTARMDGYSIEELKMMTIKDLHPEGERPLLPAIFKEISEKGFVTGLSGLHHLRKDGRLVPIEVNARMIELAGKPVNFAIVRDLTEREKAREALERSEAFLIATGRMAKVGGWELDIQTLKESWTDETCRIAEVPSGYRPSLEEAINFFHPEDRPRLEQVIQRALEYGEPYDIEIRFITATGRHLWTHAIGKPQVVDGRTVKLAGTFQDITERKKAEDALHRKDHDIRTAYANVFSAVTDEKLLILTPEEIAATLGEPCAQPYSVASFEELAGSREFIRTSLKNCGLSEDKLSSMILASGEAVANGVKHAGSSVVQPYRLEGAVQIQVSDTGPGIDFSDLPKATLLPGFSTKKSLGMGFAVILDACDRVLLSTGPQGTTLVLESGGEKAKDTLEDILSRGFFDEGAA